MILDAKEWYQMVVKEGERFLKAFKNLG